MAARTRTKAAAPVAAPAAETALATLQGWELLAPETQGQLGRLGSYLATLPAGDELPRTYEMVAAVAAFPVREDPEAYRAVLPHLERMAMQGMLPVHIAARLGLDRKQFAEALAFMPEWRDALAGGKARGIELAASKLIENVRHGDPASVSLYLRSQGDFKPDGGKASRPLVTVNIGAEKAPVDIKTIDHMAASQNALFADFDSSFLD